MPIVHPSHYVQVDADHVSHLQSPETNRQTTLFDLLGDTPAAGEPIGRDLERAYARRAAGALGAYLRNHSTGTLEAALANAHLSPPTGVRLWVVHSLAVRLALREGWAVQTGSAMHALARHAHQGLVRIYRQGPRR
jgi:hypothetical protein